ncbi:hypothetical protein [Streptomyces soliscabiei]|uniref:hypothetical protein n=1 Tax=Streptomyces soliscabiei TaxID=588897 RepID=UPI0029B2010B|nr:hypothetical protein [Streptomyces sp. NY05-11A]MDX2681207.1 hypothetical protein [Streptomyces sp. NY05-11A]
MLLALAAPLLAHSLRPGALNAAAYLVAGGLLGHGLRDACHHRIDQVVVRPFLRRTPVCDTVPVRHAWNPAVRIHPMICFAVPVETPLQDTGRPCGQTYGKWRTAPTWCTAATPTG